MIAGFSGARRRRQALCVALAALFHLFFVLALLWGVEPSHPVQARPMEIVLVAPWTPSPAVVPPNLSPPGRDPRRQEDDRAALGESEPQASRNAEDGRPAGVPAVGRTGSAPQIRGVRRCGRLARTREERDACDEQLGAGLPVSGAPNGFDIDPERRYEAADPYLTRRPKDGCKAGAGGSTDPMGKEGPAAGIWCVKRF